MRILKFEGATVRDAIAKVKAELGDQAVIISTRQVRRGLLGSATEISVAIDDDEGQPAAKPVAPASPGARRAPDADVEKLINPLRGELRSLRAMVRTSSDGRATTELRSEMATLRKLVEDLSRRERAQPKSLAHEEPTTTPLVRASSARAIMLVGPTGAGKTTTIAKLAARAALIDGKRVKLVTLDNYRVAGIDQIRTYADLIGIPLEVAESPRDLVEILDDNYDLVLIDTAGRSPRDTASIDELANELPDLPPIEVHLVVPAASSPAAIDELASRYRPLAPARLLVTKLDEVESCPDLARAPGRLALSLTWVTTGQDVPEDIEEPSASRVLELAARGLELAQRVA
jgi:flagellar biosynthesis protein FlhF